MELGWVKKGIKTQIFLQVIRYLTLLEGSQYYFQKLLKNLEKVLLKALIGHQIGHRFIF